MNWWYYITSAFGVVGVIAGALVSLATVFAVVTKPITKVKGAIRTAIREELKPVCKELKEIKTELAHIRHSEIVNFAHDIKHGEKKNSAQWTAMTRLCHEYLDSGKNGDIKILAEYLVNERKKSMVDG